MCTEAGLRDRSASRKAPRSRRVQTGDLFISQRLCAGRAWFFSESSPTLTRGTQMNEFPQFRFPGLQGAKSVGENGRHDRDGLAGRGAKGFGELRPRIPAERKRVVAVSGRSDPAAGLRTVPELRAVMEVRCGICGAQVCENEHPAARMGTDPSLPVLEFAQCPLASSPGNSPSPAYARGFFVHLPGSQTLSRSGFPAVVRSAFIERGFPRRAEPGTESAGTGRGDWPGVDGNQQQIGVRPLLLLQGHAERIFRSARCGLLPLLALTTMAGRAPARGESTRSVQRASRFQSDELPKNAVFRPAASQAGG